MSWNGNDNKDPWGREDGPPEIDDVIKKAKRENKFYFWWWFFWR